MFKLIVLFAALLAFALAAPKAAPQLFYSGLGYGYGGYGYAAPYAYSGLGYGGYGYYY